MGQKDKTNGGDDSPDLDHDDEPPVRAKPEQASHYLRHLDPVSVEQPEAPSVPEVPRSSTPFKAAPSSSVPDLRGPVEKTNYRGYVFAILGCILAIVFVRHKLELSPLPEFVSKSISGPRVEVYVPPAKIRVETDVVGFELFINGVPQKLFNNELEFPADTFEHNLTVRRVGYNDFEMKIIPGAGTSIVVHPVFTPAASVGFLTFETVPEAKLTIFQDGKKIMDIRTPFEGVKLPVGTYQAILENTLIGYRAEETIRVEEWKTTNVRRQLSGK